MTHKGRQVAIEYGKNLPAFSNPEEAKVAWFAFRDEHLAILENIAQGHLVLAPDFQPESLKDLELWYFQLYETNSFQHLNVTQEVFETCMAMYFGEIAVRNANAHWIVEEYFLAKGRYQFGINKGLLTMMLKRFTDHYREPNNKRRQSLYRLYLKYFSR
jgi:hypothetical protein